MSVCNKGYLIITYEGKNLEAVIGYYDTLRKAKDVTKRLEDKSEGAMEYTLAKVCKKFHPR
jgi:hypothetical protein